MIKIALVDDHHLLRALLGDVINQFDSCHVVISAKHGLELIEQIELGNLPDLVILDLFMKVMDGFETAQWLRDHHPDIPVLVLSMLESDVSKLWLIKTGVRGFLKKDIGTSELKAAIRSTIETGYSFDGGKMISLLSHPALNEKEMQFLKLAATEKTYKEIARIMEVSPRTVDSYRDHLLVKLNLESRTGLVLYAIKNGIVWPEY